MKTNNKYRLLLSITLISTMLIAFGALDAIDSLYHALEDIDEMNSRQIVPRVNKQKIKNQTQKTIEVNKPPAPTIVPTSGGSCPISNLDEFHRSLFFKKD